jgi:hypothetical protein
LLSVGVRFSISEHGQCAVVKSHVTVDASGAPVVERMPVLSVAV